MKPLETHLELSCHQALLSRVKEVMDREGLLPPNAGREDVKAALLAWFDFIENARRGPMNTRGANCEDIESSWH